VRKPAHNAVDVELEVPFHDVDALNIVWHGHYYKYAEIGRTALMRSRGLDYGSPATVGRGSVVIETRCRYAYPLRYGNKFRVRSWFLDVEHRICIAFEIYNITENRRSARGFTTMATIDAEGNLLLETPHDVVQLLR